MTGLHIDFDELDGEYEEELQAGPAERVLGENIAQAGTTSGLQCFQLLDPETQARIEAEAVIAYDQLSDNPSQIMDYGSSAVAGLNLLTRRMSEDIVPIAIPKLTELTDELTRQMGQLHDKYNVRSPKVIKEINRAINGRGRFLFHKADDYLRGLMLDAQDTRGKVDVVHGDLINERARMIRNMTMQTQLYRETQLEILKLIRVIATLEKVAELAQEEMKLVAAKDNTLTIEGHTEEVAEIGDFIRLVNLQTTAYKDRLIQAWATLPNIRDMRSATMAMALSIDNLLKLTVPVMESTVVKWMLLVEAKQATQFKDIIANAANKWVIAGAEAEAEAIPAITKAAFAPTITAETSEELLRLMLEKTGKMTEAYDETAEKQRALNRANQRLRDALQDADIESAEHAIDSELIERATRLSR